MSNQVSDEESPYNSQTDLRNDEDDFKSMKRSGRGKKAGGGIDLDEVENTVRSAQQETEDLNTHIVSIFLVSN